MKPGLLWTAAALLLLVACNGDSDNIPLSGLSVTGITPARASAEGGAVLALSGGNFFEPLSGGAFQHELSVTVCGAPLTDLAVTGVERQIVTPAGQRVTVRVGDTLTGVLPLVQPMAAGDVVVTRPDGQSATLEGAFTCYDPMPVVAAFGVSPSSVAVAQPASFAWTVSSPGRLPLSCTLDPGDGSAPYEIADCQATTARVHRYEEKGRFTAALTVEDGQGRQRTETLEVAVGNRVPVAATPDLAVDEDTPVGFTLGGSDADGDPLSFAVTDPPEHGSLSGAAPKLTYTPDADWSGTDGFLYVVSDGADESLPATVTIAVAAVNDAPLANDSSVSGPEDEELAVTLMGSDPDANPLVYLVVTPPGHGELSGDGANRSYLPDPNYNGVDSFSYKANDGSLDSNIANVSIAVTPVDDAPDVSNFSKTGGENTVIGFSTSDFVAAYGDLEGDAMQKVRITRLPATGTLALAGVPVVKLQDIAPKDLEGLSYTPYADWSGTDTFNWNALDGSLFAYKDAVVTITIVGAADPP